MKQIVNKIINKLSHYSYDMSYADDLLSKYDDKRLKDYEEELANMSDDDFKKEYENMMEILEGIDPDDTKSLAQFDKFFNILRLYLTLSELPGM